MSLENLKILFVGLVASLFVSTTSWAQQGAGQGYYWGPHMMWGGGWTGGFSMIIFWVLVIVAIFFGIRWASRSGDFQRSERPESALDVLKRRYASGEIDREQYQNMKKDLQDQ